jgi:hypothetical protein
VKTRLLQFHDRRNAEQMRRYDNVQEYRWRARVRLNSKEVDRLAGKPVAVRSEELRPAELPSLLRRQAS